MRAETREGFELESVASCGSNGQRRRPKLDFRSGEPFNDYHRSTTLGTAPEIVWVGSVLIGPRFPCFAEQLKAKWQEGGASSVGQETEVADAHETFGKQVQQETGQELIE